MKNLGKTLSKTEQKEINGRRGSLCIDQCMGGAPCDPGSSCVIFACFPWQNQPSLEYGLCVSNDGNQ